jgi:hypothetical protein
MSEQAEGYDFVCAICEGGNGSVICETCNDRLPAVRSWLARTETPLAVAQTGYVLVPKGADRLDFEAAFSTGEPVARVFLHRSQAADLLGSVGESGYEIREVDIVLLDHLLENGS